MPFRHSYEVELRRLEIKLKSLQLSLTRHPHDQHIKEKIESVTDQIEWFKDRIANGKDTGAYVR